MEDYRCIIAAVDYSKYSEHVVKHAALIASKMNAELVLLHIISQRQIETIEYTYQKIRSLTDAVTLESLVGKLKKDREHKMNTYLNLAEATTVETRSLIRTGMPETEIVKAARELKADLVVVGEKGRGDLMDTLVGSVVQKMVRRCPTSLLIVRPEKEHRKS